MTRNATPETIPLTEADAGFVYFARPGRPLSIHTEVHLAGRLDPERLLAAAQAACERHPMGRARMVPFQEGDRSYQWEIQDRAAVPELEIVDCADDSALAAARARLLENGPPVDGAPFFRLALAHRPHGDALVMVSNHTVSDGTGVWRILVSIFRSYTGVEDPVPELDPLQARDLRPLVVPDTRRERLRRLSKLPAVFAKASLPGGIASDGGIAPNGAGGEDGSGRADGAGGPVDGSEADGAGAPNAGAVPKRGAGGGEGVYLMSFDEREAAVLDRRRRDASTLNDVMLGGLILTIRRWNTEHGARSGKICLTVPVNLRPQPWSDEVLGNFASLMPVAMPKAAPDSLDELIAAVTKRTQKAKKKHTAQAMFDLIPSVMRRLSLDRKSGYGSRMPETLERLQDTAVFSNLGRFGLPDLGEAGPVQGAWMSPPARFTRGFAVAVLSLDGHMHFGVRYQRAYFDEEAAAAFAALYRSVLLAEDDDEMPPDPNPAP